MKNKVWTKGLVCGIIVLMVGTGVVQNFKTTVKADPTDGLVGYWNFNEGTDTIVHDSSGNGNNGTIYGDSQWVNGVDGTGLLLNGDDIVVIQDNWVLNPSQFTVCCWVKFNRLAYGNGWQSDQSQMMICKGGDRTSGAYFLCQAGSDPSNLFVALQIGEFWNGNAVLGYFPFETDYWYFVTGTYDGDIMKIYLDGVLLASKEVGNISVGNDSPLYFSYNDVGGFPYFLDGVLDEERIYNKALSEEEIALMYYSNSYPRIYSYQPSGILRGNVSSIYLHFNHPMNESSFSIGEDIISFIGPQGTITINNFSWITPNELKLIFEPQSVGGHYNLIIGSQIFNVSGIALDQDEDEIPGEVPDDYCTVSFTIDSTGPRVTRNNPSGDIAGTFSYVDVWFSEKINLSTLPSSVIISGPGGSITPSSISEVGLNCYRISISAQTTYGVYNITLMPTVEDVVGNKMDQDRDGIQGKTPDDTYSFSLNLVEVDLTLFNVTTSEPVLWTGETINISWDGANYGGMPLIGDWTDAVYCSEDHQWDINDKLLGTIPHTGGLLEDEVYSASINAVIPGVISGDYYIIVRADLYNQEKEGGDEGNNIVPVGPIPLDVRSLIIDSVQVNGSMNDVDLVDYFAIGVNSSRNFAVIVDEISPGLSVEVFVSCETVPDRLTYEYRSTSNPQGGEQVLIGGSLSGIYYVFVYAKQLTGVGSYHIKAVDLGDIYLSDISPETSGVITKCTMTLSGVGFNHNTSIEYIGPDLNIHTPDDIQLISSTTLTAVLDVPTWPQEVYDVVVRNNDNASSELIDAFEVTPGVPYLDARLIVPSWVGRHAFSTLWIEYKNTGNSSMPAPLFKLNGTENAILTIDSSIERSGLWTDNPPTGTNDTVWVMANGSGMTPGILQPGDSGRIPVYYLGLKTPWSWSGSVVFNLAIVDPDNNELINWDFFKNEMRPYWWIGDDAWHAIWLNYIDLVGNHWLTYLEILNTNANYLKRIGSETNDPRKCLSFEFRKADGLNPIRNLETVVDINIPSPGLPLSFSRMYQQPISRRYQLGVLGRGWTNSWDVHFEKNIEGDIAIFDDTGTPRIFDNINNNYEGQPGDHGVLTSTGGGSLSLRELNGLVTTFNSDGSLNYLEDSNGNRITAEYDTGRITSLTHSNGDQLLIEYNVNGRIWHITDPRGPDSEDDYVVTYEYDPSGEYLIRVMEPSDRITNYTYETAGTLQQRHALLSIEYSEFTHRYFRYNTRGWLNETCMDGNAEVITFNYNLYDCVVMEDATKNQMKFWFGPNGNIVKISDGENNTISLNNDDLQKEVIITGPSGEKFTFLYDNLGNIIGIRNPLNKETMFNYESSFNKLDSVTDARGNKILYDYDSSGNLDTITYEDGNSESFTYGSSGNVLNWTNSRNNTIGYTYNSAGQITSKDYPDTSGIIDYIYSYDEAGNLISATDPYGTTNLTYDPETDWLIRIDYPDWKFFVFNYNDAGQRTKRIDQDGNIVNYLYDNISRLDQITNTTNALIVDYDYDESGRLLQKTLGNGVYTTYDYDNVGLLVHLVNYNSTDAVISRFDYIYDASGRCTSMTTLNGTFYYTYDLLGQLISVTYPDNPVIEYVYDAVGNRIKVIDNGTVTSYSTNEMNQYTNVGGITYTYDDDGNMISKTEADVTTIYTYDFENRLIGVTTPTDSWTYSYDAFGNRFSSNHNGNTTYSIFDPIGLGEVAAEYSNSGTLIASYYYGYGLISKINNSFGIVYYTFDPLGSTSELISENGLVLNRYAFDPFGKTIYEYEIIPNSFKFIGEYGIISEKNGLFYMRSRYYDSNLGKFISKDPLNIKNGNINLYIYVNNNPVNYIDPSGLYTVKSYCEIWKGFLADIPFTFIPLMKNGKIWKNYVKTWFIVNKIGSSVETSEDILNAQTWFDWVHLIAKPITEAFFDALNIPFGGSLIDMWDRAWMDLGNTLAGLPPDPYCGISKDPPYNPNAFTKPVGEGGSVIASSVDPNDKVAPNGYGGAKYISEKDQLMPYMICFENQANATGPAQVIRIIDTFDDDLDLSTFELVDIAFADQVIDIPPGFDHYETSFDLAIDNEYITATEIRCEIDVSLDYETRSLTCEMIGLDPNTGWLPENVMLGILYPDDDNGRGEGHITYLIEHLEDLPTGTEITNKASIYFDWNDPIDTPLTLNTIDAGVPTSHVNPLTPIVNDSSLIVSWTGEDETNGSGIAYFDVYVSDNNGTYMAWLVKSTLTEETFYGEPSHTYSFYSIAIDNVGHAETAPEEPDATVFFYLAVLANFTYTPVTPSVGEEITFDASFSYDPDGFITNYQWDFDDGNVTNAANPIITHTYNSAGDFSVTLTITDNNGNHDSISKTIPVSTTLYITSLLYRWNFISLPFNQSMDKTILLVKYNGSEYTWQDAVNQGIVLGFIYEWNRIGQNYMLTDTLNPGHGYWVYAYHDCELLATGVSGFASDQYITDLYLNWNIMGVPDNEPVEKQNLTIQYTGTMYTWQEAVTNNIILGFIYQWNEAGQNYQLTDVLQPGKSYWMYAYHNCTLLRPTI